MPDEALGLPSIPVGFEVGEVVDLRDAQIVHHEAGSIHRIVRDVLEADLHRLPGVGCEVDLFLDPGWRAAVTAHAGVRAAEGVAVGVLRGAGGGGQDLPGRPAIGTDLHVGVVPVLLDVVPGPELQRCAVDFGEVELTGQGHVRVVPPIRPPQVLAAVGGGVDQAGLCGAGEGELEWLAALYLDVVGPVLADGGLVAGRELGVGAGDPDLRRVHLRVPVAAVVDGGVVQQVGYDPVGEDVLGGYPGPELCQDRVHGGEAVLRVGHQGLGGFGAESIQEVGGEHVPGTVAGEDVIGVIVDVGELGVRAAGEAEFEPPGVEAGEVGGEHREALVEPGVLVPVGVPVDHVLELVGQRAVVAVAVDHLVLEADVEHLHLVGVLPHGGDELVGAGVVPTDAAQAAGVEDVDVRVTIHARRPLGAEEGAHGGVGVALEGLGRLPHAGLVRWHPLLHPHVEVIGLVHHHRGDVELLVGVGVRDVEDPRVADVVVGWSGLHLARCIGRQSLQADRQFVQVADGDHGVCQELLRLRRHVRSGLAADLHRRLGPRIAGVDDDPWEGIWVESEGKRWAAGQGDDQRH